MRQSLLPSLAWRWSIHAEWRTHAWRDFAWAASADPGWRLSAEVYTAESLTRYAACMFYALLLAGTLAAGTSVFNLAHALNATSAVSTAVGAGIACFTYLGG